MDNSNTEFINNYFDFLRYWSQEKNNNFAKGILFENYVIERFPEEYFEIIEYTPKMMDLKNRNISSKIRPDFMLREYNSGESFYIECKYRSKIEPYDTVNPKQIEGYKSFKKNDQNNNDIFIILGVGGTPENPEKLFAVDIENINDENQITNADLIWNCVNEEIKTLAGLMRFALSPEYLKMIKQRQ
jgi:hypothetical protein